MGYAGKGFYFEVKYYTLRKPSNELLTLSNILRPKTIENI